MRIARWAALLALACHVPLAAQAPENDAIQRGRALAQALVAGDTLPGLSLAVLVDGRIVWAEGFGWADVEQRRPVTTETRYRVGSVAKPLTAAAVGLLHQRGRLNLDAPVQAYVPGFPEKPWPVTTRQVMGHTAGFRHYLTEAEIFDRIGCGDVVEGLDVFAGDSLLFQPGTRYSYSSYGFTLASAVVQAAAGEPFAAFMRREVFAPLGMDHTSPDSGGAEVASPYDRHLGVLTPSPEANTSCTLAAGGFVSTPSDLVRFGDALLNGRLLAPETVELLWTPQRLESGEGTGYGMGWFIRRALLGSDSSAVRMIGHGGRSIGGVASFMIFPEERMVVAVATNVTYADGVSSLALRLANLFRPRDHPSSP